MKVTNNFVSDLLYCLDDIGYPASEIVCILQEGSSLYLKDCGDIDFKVVVKNKNSHAEILKEFDIEDKRVDCVFYSLKEWNEIAKYKKMLYFITESPDMLLVYGTDKDFVRHDIVKDKELARRVLDNYDKCFWNYQESYKIYGYYPMEEKRLWNFLLFYFKCENKSHKLTQKQLKILQKAHDLKYSKTMFKDYFNKLKGEIL